jgi:hypothetical protein
VEKIKFVGYVAYIAVFLYLTTISVFKPYFFSALFLLVIGCFLFFWEFVKKLS